MTLKNIVNYFKYIASQQPAIKSSNDGDVYAIMNNPKNEKYAAFVITPNKVVEVGNFRHYSLTLFFIDRLTENEDNELDVQSFGIEVLSNIVQTVCDGLDLTMPRITYTPFTQKFNSLCAGAFAQIEIEASIASNCPEIYE